MRRVSLAVALCLAVALVACGNQVVLTASDVARSYVSALAEGGFQAACTMLAPEARRPLESSARVSCAALLARCLPGTTTILSHDQSQLLYVNTNSRDLGCEVAVRLSGTAVAREIREVTLTNEHGRWLLSTPGANITRCAHKFAHRRARRA